MNKMYSLLVFVIISGAVIISGCTDNSQTGNNSSNLGPNEIAMQNSAFNPSTLTVKAGTTVTWINMDSATHDVISDDGTFKSGNLNKGQSYKFKFNKTGQYNYYCSFHPSMTGTITVN